MTEVEKLIYKCNHNPHQIDGYRQKCAECLDILEINYLKLLEFVTTISNEYHSRLEMQFYSHHAKKLLKEIGELDGH